MTWAILFITSPEPRFVRLNRPEGHNPTVAGQATPGSPTISGSELPGIGLDPLTFAREILHFQPFEKQAQILDPSIRRAILLCSRQWGKSTVMAARATWLAINKPESTTLIVAPVGSQANETLVKATGFLYGLGIRTRRVKGYEYSAKLPNGSRLIARPGNPWSIRGIAADLLILDEAAFLPEDLYPAVLPMLATTGGELWLASTPHGRRGFFYKEWMSKEKSWTRITSTADDSPYISKEEIARQKLLKGHNWIQQEYFCKWADPDDAFFDMEQVNKCIDDSIKPLFPNGY